MNHTVLLVDDDTNVTRSMRVALRREPFDILTANSAHEGLTILDEHHVDVVVSDERMPRMSGSEFLTRVRRSHPNVGRIILTGEASVEATVAAINDAEIHHYLLKPCAADVLAGALHTTLAQANTANGPPATPEQTKAFDEALDGCRMVYQPIVTTEDHQLFGYEALLRVDHAIHSTPVSLIQAATQLNRRFELDQKVRHLVAADMPSLPADVSMFVNILPESLEDATLLEQADALAPFRDRVVLEVTERAPLSMIDGVDRRLEELRGLGYRLALDDLGAGYAGLTSLATMQPDIVKFDMELIRSIHRRPTQSALVSAMIVVCRQLGSLTLAEGLEDPAEIEHLHDLGCDLIQGFAIAKPEPPFTVVDPTRGDAADVRSD